MRFIIFGGGCYGSFYARQLLRAQQAGAAAVSEIVVVDRNHQPPVRRTLQSPLLHFAEQDWDAFCDVYFADLPAESDDQIVPPPFTPHLALAWLLRRLSHDHPARRWSTEPLRILPGTPWQNQSAEGTVTLSHADWMCPVHCIEPSICPHTRGPRDWDMARTIEQWQHDLDDAGQPIEQVHLFQCLHYTHGVGTYPAAKVIAARRDMSTAAGTRAPLRFLVGTVSHCHGAVHLLKVDAGTDTVSPETAHHSPEK